MQEQKSTVAVSSRTKRPDSVPNRKLEAISLLHNIQEARLKFRTKIPLDGNYLFHALCDQLEHHGIGRY